MKRTLGVIVSRMQVAQLHEGHLYLTNTVISENDDSLILIGDRNNVNGANNPLPGNVRIDMIKQTFPTLTHVGIYPDTASDEQWSQGLDDEIDRLFPEHEVTLYCSRDGFVDYYSGRFQVKVIGEHPSQTGTEQRQEILDDYHTAQDLSVDFRRGLIAAAASRLPIVFSTVDVAVMDFRHTHVWLGQKREDCGKWRFPGGFVDPADKSRAAAALREAAEELGNIKLDNIIHLGDCPVDDFRYRDEADSVMTDLFLVTHTWGKAVANDDLDAIDWFPIEKLMENLIPSHQELGRMLLKYLEQTNERKVK